MIIRPAIPMSVSELSPGCIRSTVQGKSSDKVTASGAKIRLWYYYMYNNTVMCISVVCMICIYCLKCRQIYEINARLHHKTPTSLLWHDIKWIQFINTKINIKKIYFVYSTIMYAIHPQLKCGVQCGKNTDTPRNTSHPK